jgi:hypothetical protein
VKVVTFYRMEKLSMRPGKNSRTGSTHQTAQYIVDGLLPEEGRAWLCLDGDSWTILRENDGVYANLTEHYESAEAALGSMDLSN